MSLERSQSITLPSSGLNGRSSSPGNNSIRHRAPQRSSAIHESNPPFHPRRRSSFFSENFSETHKSLRSSTDDLLLPRISLAALPDDIVETSHWHSLPLGLALLPAVGGLLFKNGSAVITDVTLLGLAAIFLNWALRLPWEWYHSAQSTIPLETDLPSPFMPSEEGSDTEDQPSPDVTVNGRESSAKPSKPETTDSRPEDEKVAAQKELRVHELTALTACFVFPLLGAWLLHGIRSQLSRPSEGLVSNYNLTIFILVAELRPLSHLMKLIQRRTLFLQRRVTSPGPMNEQSNDDKNTIMELSSRLGELEAHVADAAAASSAKPVENVSPDLVAKASLQATSDMRKTMQPELDALSRAMRRYEKRMTISAIQVEARLQDLETRVKDVVVLAAAAQRSVDKHPRNYIMTLANWVSAAVVIPVRLTGSMVSLPGKVVHSVFGRVQSFVNLRRGTREPRELKLAQKQPPTRVRSAPKRSKGTV